MHVGCHLLKKNQPNKLHFSYPALDRQKKKYNIVFEEAELINGLAC